MYMITDEVIDGMIGKGSISAEQAKLWLKAQRGLYENCMRAQRESIDGYRERIEELTNYDYEARIEELESQVADLDYQCFKLKEKHKELVAALTDLLEEANNGQL